jgi:hypothetical protein
VDSFAIGIASPKQADSGARHAISLLANEIDKDLALLGRDVIARAVRSASGFSGKPHSPGAVAPTLTSL